MKHLNARNLAMNNNAIGSTGQIDVVVIGAGPAGLSAATELKRRGLSRIVVLEREPQAGGIPRHCGHPPFGMREFKRILTGPKYAKKLVETALAAGVELHTSTTVVDVGKGGHLLITTTQGPEKIKAARIVFATGVRESTRSARLISGTRPPGVINTGALQSMVYLKGQKPFERPVIIGTELVSFSALQTCRHANIRPVAMVDEVDKVTARWPVALFAHLAGVPLNLGSRLIGIRGDNQVSAIEIENSSGQKTLIDCDGVILTGRFIPEASLARCGHLAVDPATNGPLVDQFGRCSDPAYFAAGNILRPVETAGWSWNEGRQIGRWVADDLAGKLPACDNNLQISTSDPLIRYIMPQKVVLPYIPSSGMGELQLRFSRCAKGTLLILNGNGVVYQRKLSVYPERRILVSLKQLAVGHDGGPMELKFEEARR